MQNNPYLKLIKEMHCCGDSNICRQTGKNYLGRTLMTYEKQLQQNNI